VHRSLTSLAIELDASVRAGMELQPVLAQVWKKPDGHLVLLDFPCPGLTASTAYEHLSPVALLAASARALGLTAEPIAPLSGTKLLNRLASGARPSLADVKTELVRLASTPNRPSRGRRAVPIVMAAMPVAALVLIVSVMLPMFARSLQGDGGNMIRQRNDFMRWMMWLSDSGADSEFKTREQRTAAEQYVAAHFGSQLTSDELWNMQAPQIEPFLTMKRTAAEIAARYPAVSPDELSRASAIVAPQIQELAAETANLGANIPAGGEALRGLAASGFASIPVMLSLVCGLISVLAVPGGLVTRALGHAVVRRDGREIGRARSAIRFVVAWSPVLVWIACVGVPMFGEPRVSPDMAFVVGSLVFLSMAAGVAWTTASPGRGPHDRIAGTWVVPR
jgi:hypothetical protein